MPPAPAPAATPAAPTPAPKPAAAAPTPPAPPKGGSSSPPTRPGLEEGQESGAWLDEAGTELDQIDRDGQAPRPPRQEKTPKPGEKPAAQKPEDQTPPEEETPPAAEDEITVPGEEATPAPEEKKPLKVAELREAYDTSQKLIKEELHPKISKLEARIKELETTPPEASGPVAEQMKALKTQNEQLESRMRLIDYSNSQEYQEKYFKPYVEAWDKCMADLAGLEVELPNGQTRKATDADIQALAVLPLGELIKQSNAMFGDAADTVREHVREIVRTNNAQTKSLEEAKNKAQEWATTNKTRLETEQKQLSKLWEDSNEALRQKFPKFFAPIEGDKEGNQLLKQGFALTALHFRNGVPSPEELALLPKSFQRDIETNGKLSPENRVRLHAMINNKAANHDRLARSLKTARAEIADLKKALAQFEESEPPSGGGTRRPAAGGGMWDEDPNREIDELDRKSR